MYIKIAHITNLQDARYCAAMGFGLISFSLLSQNERTLTAQQIREMCAWLAGTQYVLECDEVSVAELQAIHGTFPYHYIEIPKTDWEKFSFLPQVPVIIQAQNEITFVELERIIAEIQNHHKDSKVEITVKNKSDYRIYEKLYDNLLIHFSDIEDLSDIIQEESHKPWAFSLREEALDSEGYLDYEKLDNLAALIQGVSKREY